MRALDVAPKYNILAPPLDLGQHVRLEFFNHRRLLDLLSVFFFFLQDHISKLNSRLKACNLSDSVDIISSIPQESVYLPNKSLKISALIVLLTILSLPFLFFKHFDHVLKSRRLPDNTEEEVSLNKQIAYRVDVFLSVHPYAKPVSLLVATLLLICLGGLALFGVTNDSYVTAFGYLGRMWRTQAIILILKALVHD